MIINLPESAHQITDSLARWAQECLDEAVQNGRVGEVPYYARALEHLLSQQAGRPKATVIGFRPRVRDGVQSSGEPPIAA